MNWFFQRSRASFILLSSSFSTWSYSRRSRASNSLAYSWMFVAMKASTARVSGLLASSARRFCRKGSRLMSEQSP